MIDYTLWKQLSWVGYVSMIRWIKTQANGRLLWLSMSMTYWTLDDMTICLANRRSWRATKLIWIFGANDGRTNDEEWFTLWIAKIHNFCDMTTVRFFSAEANSKPNAESFLLTCGRWNIDCRHDILQPPLKEKRTNKLGACGSSRD